MPVKASGRVEFAHALLSVAHGLELAISAVLKDTELGVAHYLLLRYVCESGPVATSELARIALVPPATLTRVLDRLVDLALVYRVLDSEDRRRIKIRSTARGEAKTREISSRVDEALATVLPDMRKWEMQALMDWFGRLSSVNS